MNLKERIEVNAQSEKQERKDDPGEAPLAQAGEEEWKRDIQRREKKETIETDAIFEALQICLEGLRSAGPKRRLHLVLELLLAREFEMGDRIRLPGERGRHAVLKAAQLIRQRGPIAGDLLVLQQRESDGGDDYQSRGQSGFREQTQMLKALEK